MNLSVKKIFCAIGFTFALWHVAVSQDLKRELNFREGTAVEIINNYGRVVVNAAVGGFGVTATSAKGVSDSELKISESNGRTFISVTANEKQKRVDLVFNLPARTNLKIETLAGAVEIAGDFASIETKTDTATIAVDVPADDLRYQLQWTESRPRYLANFDIAAVKEKSAGRFEIKGRRRGEVAISKPEDSSSVSKPVDRKDRKSTLVSLNLSTARGIILINVPANEVMSDLRERPLTLAAKAIVRSGDSLLMEAIRRASPKYFRDYARTLPPIRMEPNFAVKSGKLVVPNASSKTALVRVTDSANRSIAGLGINDFEVLENSKSCEIVSVEVSEAPFNLVLLLDVSGSIENYVNFIRKAARSFVSTVGRNDRVAIVIFNEDVKLLSSFTTDKGKLSESLDSFDAGGGTAYYDALAYTIADTLRPLKGERTAIVILTDGDDNRSFLAFDSLAGAIQESGALIYPLYVPSGLIALAAQNINADIDPLRRKYMSLTAKSEGEGDKLARMSGGIYYPITQIGQIQKAYEDIVGQMRSAYNVTFRSGSAPVGDGASPRLKIKARRENAFTTINSVIASPDK